MDWDKEKLKQDIEGLPDDYKINYSELARQYNVREITGKASANGGADLSRFKTTRKQTEVIRRRKRKGPGGEISLPTDVTRKRLKEMLNETLQSGEYTVGEIFL
ncbi:hypothetical protein AC249_AIPGENE29106 [Exaiptasia diaphana]|nr:hypothetical protein AC249_AIPGENE29106 [Exaiptasia diaphana]